MDGCYSHAEKPVLERSGAQLRAVVRPQIFRLAAAKQQRKKRLETVGGGGTVSANGSQGAAFSISASYERFFGSARLALTGRQTSRNGLLHSDPATYLEVQALIRKSD